MFLIHQKQLNKKKKIFSTERQAFTLNWQQRIHTETQRSYCHMKRKQ